MTDLYDPLQPNRNVKGISFWTATVFIVGEVAGAGILSLPHSTAQAGWSGLAVMVYCALCAAISGICLAKSWLILEERYPEKYGQGEFTRKPYATIGYHAFGKYMSAIVSIIMNISRIGAVTVFTLVSSNLIRSLTKTLIPNLSLCHWIPIVAGIILIPLWAGSPMDFWPIAYTAMITSVLGTILLIINLSIELLNGDGRNKDYHVENFETFSGAFGAMLFAYSGASAFPTVQNDMKQKERFPIAIIVGFIALTLLYVPVSGLGYAMYGFKVNVNIIYDLPPSALITVVKICFSLHCATAFFISINPVFLDLEELLRIPKPFNWKRCLFRTLLLALVVLIAETFPSFGQILDLIGGATISFLAFAFPPVFYVKLIFDQKQDSKWPQRHIPLYMLVAFGIIVLTAIFSGIASTYTTLRHWIPLEQACYIDPNRYY